MKRGLRHHRAVVAIVVLVAMMLFTVLNVFLRAFFNRPLPGDVELTEIAMVCTSFLGLAWCALKGRHVRVDLVVGFLPKRAQGIIDTFGYLAALVACSVIAWQSFLEGIANRALDKLSASLGIPVFPFYWVTAVGFGILCLAVVVLLVRSFFVAVKK